MPECYRATASARQRAVAGKFRGSGGHVRVCTGTTALVAAMLSTATGKRAFPAVNGGVKMYRGLDSSLSSSFHNLTIDQFHGGGSLLLVLLPGWVLFLPDLIFG